MTAFEWATTSTPTNPPSDYYCQSVDVWQGRFTKIAPTLIRAGINNDSAALFASVVGEIGDNCFAHNAPGWVDIPGCWFEYRVDGHTIHCWISDRGRGILTSLKAAIPSLQTHREALVASLTKRISGRIPEQRGNGLKFVVAVLTRLPAGVFTLQTGDASFHCNLPLNKTFLESSITLSPTMVRGTYCEITATLPYEN